MEGAHRVRPLFVAVAPTLLTPPCPPVASGGKETRAHRPFVERKVAASPPFALTRCPASKLGIRRSFLVVGSHLIPLYPSMHQATSMRTHRQVPVDALPAEVVAGNERALHLLEQDAPLTEVLAQLVRTVENASERTVIGSILVVDGTCLRHGAAPSLPANYNRIVDGLAIGPYGTCCAAAHRNQVVITSDIGADPGWAKLKEYPLAIRLRAAWSHPIRDPDGKVLGTFGTYFRECREPTENEQHIVATLAQTAARAIQQRSKSSRATRG